MGAKIMNRKIRWGLLGAGKILDRWMKGACQIDDMEIVAVASRARCWEFCLVLFGKRYRVG